MSNVISIINQKGGVAKTTTVFTLANYYADKGMRVLAVDLDSQSNLTAISRIEDETANTIKDYFLDSSLTVEPIQIKENLSVIPCNISFSASEMSILNAFNREHILSRIIDPIKEQYDICLIDCPPALNIVTINALTASDFVIIPLKPSSFSYIGLESMISFLRTIKEAVNPKLVLLGALLTFFEGDRVVARKILEQFTTDNYDIILFDTKIRKAEAIVRAEQEKMSILEYDNNSNVAEDYKKLGEEIIEKLNTIKGK